jgi:kynureninase
MFWSKHTILRGNTLNTYKYKSPVIKIVKTPLYDTVYYDIMSAVDALEVVH